MQMAKMVTTFRKHLPDEIISDEILPRLPVKSLIRFKCVSRRWRSVISDPKFAKSHFKRTCEQQSVTQRLLIYKYEKSHFESLDLQTTSFGSSVTNLTAPFKPPDDDSPFKDIILVGSSNGLVCVALVLNKSANFLIWNPSTGFSKKLPDPGFGSYNISIDDLYDYGFGYVSETDDYKFIVTASFFIQGDPVEIFSSRANSWKRIKNPVYADPDFITPGVLSNKALHWVKEYGDGILAFDLGKEEYRELSLPVYENITRDNFHFEYLGVSLDGCLCVMCSVAEGLNCMEFWVMREYGVSESWSKFFKFVIKDFAVAVDDSSDLTFIPVHLESRRVVAVGEFYNDAEKGDGLIEQLIRLDQTEGDLDQEEGERDNVVVCSGIYSLMDPGLWSNAFMKYNESLIMLHDYNAAESQTTQLHEMVEE